MGSDIQRALLWILFGLSAFMLYDRWEVYNGRPSFFGAETQQVATTEARMRQPFRASRRRLLCLLKLKQQ